MRYHVWTIEQGLQSFPTEDEQRAYWATVSAEPRARYWKETGSRITVTAPFLIGGAWKDVTFPLTGIRGVHQAIIDKASELGATAWDYGQAKVR